MYKKTKDQGPGFKAHLHPGPGEAIVPLWMEDGAHLLAALQAYEADGIWDAGTWVAMPAPAIVERCVALQNPLQGVRVSLRVRERGP